MTAAPLGLGPHALDASELFALWPITRLVYLFRAPVDYLTRPYIVYQSHDDALFGSHRSRHGWDRVG